MVRNRSDMCAAATDRHAPPDLVLAADLAGDARFSTTVKCESSKQPNDCYGSGCRDPITVGPLTAKKAGPTTRSFTLSPRADLSSAESRRARCVVSPHSGQMAEGQGFEPWMGLHP